MKNQIRTLSPNQMLPMNSSSIAGRDFPKGHEGKGGRGEGYSPQEGGNGHRQIKVRVASMGGSHTEY